MAVVVLRQHHGRHLSRSGRRAQEAHRGSEEGCQPSHHRTTLPCTEQPRRVPASSLGISQFLARAMANMLATFAQLERRLFSQRTKEAFAVKRAQGIRLGRSATMPQAVVWRIQRQRARGDSFRKSPPT